MSIHATIERAYVRLMDVVFAHRTQPLPSSAALESCKIISHRGEHDNVNVMENTLAAFEQAAAAGVWGIELDVRWTADFVPVVAHDPDLKRVHGRSDLIARLTHAQLRQRAPRIPSLRDVVERFGRQLHLMVEIKQHEWPDPRRQNPILAEVFAGLRPVVDFHFMALQPEVLTILSGFPAQSLVTIADFWPGRQSRWVLEKHWGGFCTHFLLLRNSLIRAHQAQGQQVGAGYPASRNSLFREVNRGVDWIFSNNAGHLQAILRDVRRQADPSLC